MTRATKTKKVESTTRSLTPTSENTTAEVATTDERNWMLDLFDFPTFFARNWGFPTRWFDTEHLVTDRFSESFPMRVEQMHDGDDLVIRAELPGIDPDEDVDIDIEGRRMTIDATREDTTESGDGHRSEFHYGHFHRMMTLPEGADTTAVSATYTDGILEVRVPVHVEEETTTKVPISRK